MPATGGTGTTEVRSLSEADVSFAAALHRDALDGFFVELGEPFLRQYYETFISSPFAVALIASVDGQPRGILVGTVDHGAHYRWIARHRRTALALSAVRALIGRPRLAASFVRTRAGRYARGVVRLARRRGRSEPTHIGPITGVLTHVAVLPASRDNGVGSTLVGRYVEEAFAGVATRLRVATKSEDGATAFYRRLGWRDDGSMQNLDGAVFDVLVLER